ncbi:ParB/RepB/Spo0J family partition protein [Bacilliculturomica massiliensis]|uniref:ParB/RepB/Spo0J family partition protein n=1 Tax=Bacilliculturomica massiliensis TaxID=1917867 RepID=UPI00102FA386|nr:ParB/RepB/Spo0J family partition protein [Bacilliculturomica massiliensis]
MAKPKTRGLGRGLESLFSDTEIISNEVKLADESAADTREEERAGEIVFIDINDIKPNSKQPRKTFDDEKIEELASSIQSHGVIQPIMVRNAEKGYELVAGERRWRAARRAGLKKIPAIVRELDEQQNMFFAIIENMQREDLNAIEEALALDEMIRTFGLTQEEVSRSVGKSRPYITNSLRLLKLPDPVQELVSQGSLSGGHARAIAGMKGEEQQIKAAKKAVEEGWSVREMEQYAGESSASRTQKRKAASRTKRKDVQDVESHLKDVLGTKVSIQYGSRKGRIEIEYYSREELERLISLLLTVNPERV